MKTYLCTECEREISSKNIHQEYGFVLKYKINTKISYKKNKYVWFKRLCICKRCFQNYACEKSMMRNKLIRKNE